MIHKELIKAEESKSKDGIAAMKTELKNFDAAAVNLSAEEYVCRSVAGIGLTLAVAGFFVNPPAAALLLLTTGAGVLALSGIYMISVMLPMHDYESTWVDPMNTVIYEVGEEKDLQHGGYFFRFFNAIGRYPLQHKYTLESSNEQSPGTGSTLFNTIYEAFTEESGDKTLENIYTTHLNNSDTESSDNSTPEEWYNYYSFDLASDTPHQSPSESFTYS